MLYSVLIFTSMPIPYIIVKYKLIYHIPLYSFYCLFIIIFNVIGSCYIFFPELGIYGGVNQYFTMNFFYLLLFQVITMYVFLPIHISAIKKHSFYKSSEIYTLNLRYTILLAAVSILIVLLFYLANGLPPAYSIDLSIGN